MKLNGKNFMNGFKLFMNIIGKIFIGLGLLMLFVNFIDPGDYQDLLELTNSQMEWQIPGNMVITTLGVLMIWVEEKL